MHKSLLKDLENVLSPEEYREREAYALEQKVSLRQDLEWLMYAGVLLFMSGLGYFIYSQQSNSVHYIVFGTLVLLVVGLSVYLYKNKLPYSHQKVESQKIYADYLLLFTCLLVLSLTKYADYLYPIEPMPWNILIATIGIVFLFTAYLFDHKGVLSLGISTLSTLVGFNFSPEGLFENSFYNDSAGLLIMVVFSLLLLVAGYYADSRKIKLHFTSIWYNMGAIVFFVSSVWGIFSNISNFHFIALTIAGAVLAIWYALKVKEYMFMVYGSIAGYIAFTTLLYHLIGDNFWEFSVYYFFLSTVAFIVFIIKRKSFLQ